MMLSLLLILACGDSTPETTDAPKVEAAVGDGTMQNGAPDAPNAGGPGMGGPGNPGGPNAGGQMDGGMQGGGEGGPGQPTPGGTLGTDGNQELGDPNIPPDTINQGGTAPADNGQPPQPTDMANATGVQQEPSKKPPTFIYNAHSEDSGPLYKDAEGNCFVRKDWDQPNNGTMGETEVRDCPAQMSSDAWKNCPNGRLVKHNVGDKEGTCECEPIESGEAKTVDCP